MSHVLPIFISGFKLYPILINGFVLLVTDPSACKGTYFFDRIVVGAHNVCLIRPKIDEDKIEYAFNLNTKTTLPLTSLHNHILRVTKLESMPHRIDRWFGYVCYIQEIEILNGMLEKTNGYRCDEQNLVKVYNEILPINDSYIYRINSSLIPGEAIVDLKDNLFGIYTKYGMVKLQP